MGSLSGVSEASGYPSFTNEKTDCLTKTATVIKKGFETIRSEWELPRESCKLFRNVLKTIGSEVGKAAIKLKVIATRFGLIEGMDAIIRTYEFFEKLLKAIGCLKMNDIEGVVLNFVSSFSAPLDVLKAVIGVTAAICSFTGIVMSPFLAALSGPIAIAVLTISTLKSLYTTSSYKMMLNKMEKCGFKMNPTTIQEEAMLKLLDEYVSPKRRGPQRKVVPITAEENQLGRRVHKRCFNELVNTRTLYKVNVAGQQNRSEYAKKTTHNAILLTKRKFSVESIGLMTRTITLIGLCILFFISPWWQLVPTAALLAMSAAKIGNWVYDRWFLEKGALKTQLPAFTIKK